MVVSLTDAGMDKWQNGCLLTEKEIESDPLYIPSCAMDPVADIKLIQAFFSSSGWRTLQRVTKERRQTPWDCKECGQDLEIKASIGCDGCLSWSHMSCLRMKAAPKSRYWFCAAYKTT